MAATARPAGCGRCALGQVSATGSATRSTSCPPPCGERVARAYGLTLPVPHPALPSAPAQGLRGVCAGATAPPLSRSRCHHGGNGERRARPALGSGEESRLVGRARSPADAGHQPPAGASASCHRAAMGRDERLSPSSRKPTGVSHRVSAPLQPDTVSTARPAC
jgi:hypothetical protein